MKKKTKFIIKLVVYAVAIAYFLSPIDAIPDIAPIVGVLDDLVLLGVARLTDGVLK